MSKFFDHKPFNFEDSYLMKTGLTYKGLTIFLALFIFMNSVGFCVDMHLCQGKVWSVSFFGNAESCEMSHSHSKMDKSSQSSHSCCSNKVKESENRQGQEQFSSSDCCSSEQIVLNTLHDANSSEAESLSNFDLKVKAAIIFCLYFSEIQVNSENIWPIPDPPKIDNNFSILYQNFRL